MMDASPDGMHGILAGNPILSPPDFTCVPIDVHACEVTLNFRHLQEMPFSTFIVPNK
jgi:hypothetical protein